MDIIAYVCINSRHFRDYATSLINDKKVVVYNPNNLKIELHTGETIVYISDVVHARGMQFKNYIICCGPISLVEEVKVRIRK